LYLKLESVLVQVLVAVGGPSFWRFNKLNAKGIATLIKDLGLDGVEVDYQPRQPGGATLALI
jgi:chitinase